MLGFCKSGYLQLMCLALVKSHIYVVMKNDEFLLKKTKVMVLYITNKTECFFSALCGALADMFKTRLQC